MRVKKLLHNWHQNGSVNDDFGAGYDYDLFEVGKNDVYEIKENEPHNGLQKWNYVIRKNNGDTFRIFNPNYVEYFRRTNKD